MDSNDRLLPKRDLTRLASRQAACVPTSSQYSLSGLSDATSTSATPVSASVPSRETGPRSQTPSRPAKAKLAFRAAQEALVAHLLRRAGGHSERAASRTCGASRERRAGRTCRVYTTCKVTRGFGWDEICGTHAMYDRPRLPYSATHVRVRLNCSSRVIEFHRSRQKPRLSALHPRGRPRSRTWFGCPCRPMRRGRAVVGMVDSPHRDSAALTRPRHLSPSECPA